MLTKKASKFFGLKVIFVIAVLAGSLHAQVEPDRSGVGQAEFELAGLNIQNDYRLPRELPAQDLANASADLAALGVRNDSGHIDTRGGRWASLLLAKPLLPGRGKGNGLSWANLGRGAPKNDAELSAAATQAFREYLEANNHPLRIDTYELGGPGKATVHQDGAVIQIYVPRIYEGVPVRGSHLTATINHGNLTLFGTDKWGDINTSTVPGISEGDAQNAVQAYVDLYPVNGAWGKSELLLVPIAKGQDVSRVPVGKGFDYRLAWVIRPAFDGDLRKFEALVDAQTGQLLSFKDTNQYAEVKGGVYPVTNDGISPDGVEQPGWPMPYADATGGTTDTGGNIAAVGSVTTDFYGPYVNINDNCGTSSLTSASGVLDWGTSGGTDCTTPGFGGGGNTHSSRTGFYELNKIIEMGRGQLPSNSWLQSRLIANMNINNNCNAFWNGTVNFYTSGGGCNNTGEIAGVFDHEWGHGMDANDATPGIAGPSGEGIADIYTALRLNNSCIGHNFWQSGVCSGNGDPCLTCSGVRDIDYLKRQSGQPHDYTWSNANCGGSVHCVGGVYSEAVWSLWKRELQGAPYNMDDNTAHEVVTRLTYIGAGSTGTWFSGSPPNGGCAAGSGYMNYLAADDDNGNINDGTPHMEAIFNAFNDQEIACATPTVQDLGCAGVPTLAPTVNGTVSNKAVDLNWTPVAGATSYSVFRTEGVFACDFGKVKLGSTSGNTWSDSGLQNGRQYSYIVMPTSSASCFGPASSCTSVSPAAGPGISIDTALAASAFSGGDSDAYLDNCEDGTTTFDINNTGLGGLTNVHIVSVTPSNVGVTINGTSVTPSSLSQGATATGSFSYTAGGLSAGEDLTFTVEVTADEMASPKIAEITVSSTETDLQFVASRTYSFESDAEAWTTVQGTFNRSSAGGGAAGSWYEQSSANLDNQCDQIQSPVMVFSATTTLSLSTNYDIEPIYRGTTWYDRANVGLEVGGSRSLVSPDGGRAYNAGGAQGTCGTGGQGGWADAQTTWGGSSFSADALGSVVLDGQAVQLDIRYGTDASINGYGFRFDEVTVTNVSLQGTDGQSNICSVSCTVDADCSNGLFCDGAETCNAGVCEVGTPPICDDGAFCNGTETCNEGTDSCDAGTAPACDDTLYCNGTETCNEGTDSCDAGTPPAEDDGVGCTDDLCNESTDSFDHTPNDGLCENGLFCDGAETCDAVLDCQDGAPPVVDDGVGCTDDSCDEGADSIVNAPNDSLCDNSLFCDGTETCDAVLDCQAGSDPCLTGETCDETEDICLAPSSTSVHVASVVTGTVNVGKGFKHGTATVTVVDNNGITPESEYTVSGAFGGSFNDMPFDDTVDGVVTFTTDTTKKGVTVTFCVADVDGALAYESGDNGPDVTTCGALPVCGDNTIESPEVCDGINLGGETCDSLGYDGGELACQGNCLAYDTDACVTPPPQCVPTHSKEKGSRCSDGLDNDCDGLIDGDDSECQ